MNEATKKGKEVEASEPAVARSASEPTGKEVAPAKSRLRASLKRAQTQNMTVRRFSNEVITPSSQDTPLQ